MTYEVKVRASTRSIYNLDRVYKGEFSETQRIFLRLHCDQVQAFTMVKTQNPINNNRNGFMRDFLELQPGIIAGILIIPFILIMALLMLIIWRKYYNESYYYLNEGGNNTSAVAAASTSSTTRRPSITCSRSFEKVVIMDETIVEILPWTTHHRASALEPPPAGLPPLPLLPLPGLLPMLVLVLLVSSCLS